MTAARLDDVTAAILALLASAAVRGLVVAVIAGVALAALRPRRASVHLAGWTLVLGAAVAMPALGSMLPAVRWPLPIVLPTSKTVPGTAIAVHSVASGEQSPRDGVVTRGKPEGPPSEDRTPAAAPTNPRPSHESAALSVPVAVFASYLCGVLILLMRAGAGWMVAHRLRRTAPLIEDAGALARLRAASVNGGLATAPALAEADSLAVPITMSVRHPAIVLPATWRTWDAATLDAVLTHEVAHIARRDTLTQHVSLIYRAIFWFSPLGWWLRRTLATLAEHASDEAVLDAGADRAAYAETVLGFFAALKTDRRRAHWPAIAMARGTGASRRVERILAWTGAHGSRLTPSLVVAMVALGGPLVVLAASVRPVVLSSLPVPGPIPPARLIVPLAMPAMPSLADLTIEAAQTRPPAASPQPDSRSVRIDTVITDVVVRTALGRAVTGLTLDDFRIFEDGVEQKIEVFTPFVASRIVGGTRIAAAPAQSVSGRAFVVFIDDLNIAPADRGGLTRVLEIIRDYIHDDDLVSIVSTGYSSVEVDLTYDRGHARFNEALAKISRPSQAGAVPSAPPDTDRRRYMTHTALKTAYDVVQRVGQMTADRRKTFIYVSGGYDYDPVWTGASSLPAGTQVVHRGSFQASPATPEDPFAKTGSEFTEADLVAELSTLVRAANRAALTIYAVNTRTIRTGPSGMTADEWKSYFAGTGSLSSLAANTGGFMVDAADVAQGLQRIDNETASTNQSYYQIGYTSSNHDLTQKTRTVEVRVARPDVQLLYRHQYTIK